MAVPSSGQLSLNSIYNELAVNDYGSLNINSDAKLVNLSTGDDPPNEAINTANNPSSNRPDGSAPHSMSEFYDYDHDATKSDIRLKTNINLVATSNLNIPIYTFNFKDDQKVTYRGVMAQDLLKLGFEDSVTMADDGYYVVDYDNIDVEFKRL